MDGFRKAFLVAPHLKGPRGDLHEFWNRRFGEAQRVGPALPDRRERRPAVNHPRHAFANNKQHCGKGARLDRDAGPTPAQIVLLQAALRGETAELKQR